MRGNFVLEDTDYPELSANDVLANFQDFKEELGALQSLIQSSGNIVLFMSKGHP